MPWVPLLSLASVGAPLSSTRFIRVLRREISPENDAPVGRGTLVGLFGLLLALSLVLGMLRAVFINKFGY